MIFDLDGTLVDPNGGITGGIARALAHSGLPVPEESVLNQMVGPKLSHALVEFAGVPAQQVDTVIADYRAFYASEGMDMAKVYPGVVELLTELKLAGFPLAVATQKPQTLARAFLAGKGISDFFEVIMGSPDDESSELPSGKEQIVAAALAHLVQARGTGLSAVMVGDRYQDVDGARANGLDALGVRWGFANPGELEEAGATIVVDTPQQLHGYLLARIGESSGTGLNGRTQEQQQETEEPQTEDVTHGRI